MKKLITLLTVSALAAISLGLTSCSGTCCTGEAPSVPLRPLPTFGGFTK